MGPSRLQVSETAKETTRNWFFKIASIRELIPRIYVEVAILKCYRFLSQTCVPHDHTTCIDALLRSDFEGALNRLIAMIRGIGDPMVSIYARAYVCRVRPALRRAAG